LTLIIWNISGYHLKNTHTKSIDINSNAISLFIHFWSHELWCSQYRMCILRFYQRCCQSQISNTNFASIAIDEYIFAFNVAVNNRKRLFLMEVNDSFENFLTPMLDYFQSRLLYFPQVPIWIEKLISKANFLSDPPVVISVKNITSSFYVDIHAAIKWMTFGCLSFFRKSISNFIL